MVHPADGDAFALAYSGAWTRDPQALLRFFAAEGTYTDVGMGTTYQGHEEILRFHRWMLKFAPDSVINYSAPAAQDGNLYLEWLWSGSFAGTWKLRDGTLMPATGRKFVIVGIAACRYGPDGKLTSHRDFWNVAELIEELGPRRSRREPSDTSWPLNGVKTEHEHCS